MTKQLLYPMISTVLMIVGGVWLYLEHHRANELEVKVDKLDRYCRAEKARFAHVANDLEDPKLQGFAIEKFRPDDAYHEVTLCTTKQIDLSKHGICWINRDFPCLADLATRTAAAL
jgi:hypothetical protein